jgi:transcriptional regulator MraZ
MVFRGTYDHSLDAKNRLTVPAKFRNHLAAGVVLAKALEPCVQIWMPDAYDKYVDEVLDDPGLKPLSARKRKLNRFFTANAVDTELDGAGRVAIPAFLLEHAGLRKDVVVTGSGGCLEVWERDTWAGYNADLTAEIPELTAELSDAG